MTMHFLERSAIILNYTIAGLSGVGKREDYFHFAEPLEPGTRRCSYFEACTLECERVPTLLAFTKMIDPQVDVVLNQADETAERISQLGGGPDGRPDAVVQPAIGLSLTSPAQTH